MRASAVLLDLGCGLGQVLRQLAVDGCPPGRLIGLDASRALVDLGFELFRDRARPAGAPRFVVADVLAAPPPSKSAPGAAALRALDGAVDIVHAASFFHLFGWAEQLAIGVRLVAMFRRPGLGRGGSAVLVGRDLGERCPLDPAVHGPGRYRHSPASLQRLWDAIGEKTRTVWLVRAEMEDGAPSLESLERVTTITYVVARLR